MSNNSNSDFTKHILLALQEVAGRRSSKQSAATVIQTFLNVLKQKYSFLRYITVHKNGDIETSSSLDFYEPSMINEVLEVIIRIIIYDLQDKAGLFFIKELKEQLPHKYLEEAFKRGIKLDMIQLEQRYLYKRWKVDSTLINPEYQSFDEVGKKDVSLFGYSWDYVSAWNYDDTTMICTLYDKNGRILDSLHLESIVHKMTILLGDDQQTFHSAPEEISEKTKTPEKIETTKQEYQFLEMLFEKDLDADMVMHLLNLSQKDFEQMVRKLLKAEILEYCSQDEVKLTDKGINHLMSLYGA